MSATLVLIQQRPEIEVECLTCGSLRFAHELSYACLGECHVCGDMGWTPAGKMSESDRENLRGSRAFESVCWGR